MCTYFGCKISTIYTHNLLETQKWCNMWICLTDNKMVHIKQLLQLHHRQVTLQTPITPESLTNAIFYSLVIQANLRKPKFITK